MYYFFFFKQKTAYEMRISDWSSDVCSSDLPNLRHGAIQAIVQAGKDGVVTEEAALAALKSVPLGSGTPRSFLVAFAACGYLVPEIGRASCRERVCQYV